MNHAAWFAARRVPAEPVSQSRAEETGLSDRAMGLVRDGAFRRLLVINWCLSVAWDVHTFVVPVLGHERGLSASVIGAILGGFALAAAAVLVAAVGAVLYQGHPEPTPAPAARPVTLAPAGAHSSPASAPAPILTTAPASP